MNKLSPEKYLLSSTTVPRRKRHHPRSLRYWYKRYRNRVYRYLRTLKGDPQCLARGLAVGVFAGSFPFFGIQSLIGVLLAIIFRGSKVAAVMGTWVSNPLTHIPIFIFNFRVGKLLLGVESISSRQINYESLQAWRELGFTFTIVLLLGCLVVGTVLGIISYFVGLACFKRIQQPKRKFKINAKRTNSKLHK